MNQISTNLIAQSQISQEVSGWHQAVFRDIEERLGGNSEFPCVFSKNAFRKQLLKFIFVENIESSGIRHLAAGLKDYVETSKNWGGSLDTAYPLIVAFSRDAIHAESVEAYHALGWKVLKRLHDIDPAPWPKHVSKDPDSAAWSMCFDGMPLFCNMSNPAHRVRRSRNLGEHFALIINPRERFDVFAGDTPEGRKMRVAIRDRINRYDGVPHAPQLGFFGADSREWWQYGLLDDNVERTDKCPFLFRKSHG